MISRRFAQCSALVALALAGSAGVGCGDDAAPTAGTEGGPCLADGTCDPGLLCLSNLCVDPGLPDAGPTPDAAPPDGTTPDGSIPDGGVTDGGVTDGGATDSGVTDGGATDGGAADAGPDGGLPCTTGWCDLTCAEAALASSHFGCEFWPTPTVNSNLDPAFDNNFGVLVHNPNSGPALATITRAGAQVAQSTVASGQSHTFELPLDTGLKTASTDEESRQVPDAAYRLVTDVPVTAYQANPLDFLLNTACLGGTLSNPCNSYSNDAALLLPTHGLGTEHLVMSRQTFGVDASGMGMFSFIPGFLAVVGTTNSTQVTITFTAATQPGPGHPSYAAGVPVSFTLNAGDALQFLSEIPTSCTGTQSSDNCNGRGGTCSYCDMASADLTGTLVQSTDPVAVFGGHSCSFVPYNYWACDHLEEQLPPLPTWGNTVVVSRTEPQHDVGYSAEPNVIRILSGANNNALTFTPAQAIGASAVLNQGQFLEFEALDDFVVSASGPIFVAQHLVGQSYYTVQMSYWGDPAMGLVPPVGQYQTYYAFTAPANFTHTYLNVVAPVGPGSATVYLDGQPLAPADFTAAIGGTTFGAARLPIVAGDHVVTSTQPFAITVYGFAEYTSYLYAGGQGLEALNP